MDEQTYKDLAVAEQSLQVEHRTLVFVDQEKVFSAYSTHPVEALFKDNEYIRDCVIGICFLGKASALLCAYGKARAVYCQQATKTALAVLLRAGIPCQTDKMIPKLSLSSELYDSYEQQVDYVDEPESWFAQLQKTKHLIQKQ